MSDINPDLIISTECCELAKKHKAVYLDFDRDEHEKTLSQKKLKPRWYSKGCIDLSHYIEDRWYFLSSVEVKFCPFCATPVPEIELNKDIPNKKILDGDHDYCNNCRERLMCCECLPPVFRWKPIGSKITMPKIKKRED